MNEISQETLPQIGELIELYFSDGHFKYASRQCGERLPYQWHWSTPSGFIAADMPLIVGWSNLNQQPF
jgi:hypothetical protein